MQDVQPDFNEEASMNRKRARSNGHNEAHQLPNKRVRYDNENNNGHHHKPLPQQQPQKKKNVINIHLNNQETLSNNADIIQTEQSHIQHYKTNDKTQNPSNTKKHNKTLHETPQITTKNTNLPTERALSKVSNPSRSRSRSDSLSSSLSISSESRSPSRSRSRSYSNKKRNRLKTKDRKKIRRKHSSSHSQRSSRHSSSSNHHPSSHLNAPNALLLPFPKTNILPSVLQSIAVPHSGQQLKFKTTLCSNYMSGGCRFGTRCHFAHGSNELRGCKSGAEAEKIWRSKLCREFAKGTCHWGAKCRFAHGDTTKSMSSSPSSCLNCAKAMAMVERYKNEIKQLRIENQRFKDEIESYKRRRKSSK